MMFVRILASSAMFSLALSGCGMVDDHSLDVAKVLSVETRNVDDLNVTVKEVETSAAVRASLAADFASGESVKVVTLVKPENDDLGVIDATLDHIINIGKKVWAVVVAGKPVMNVKFDFATAMPKGITAASELHGFSDLQFKSFEYAGTNTYGFEVFKVQYTVVYQYAGAFGGKGAYIASASIVPQNVSVLWGYSLGMNVDNVSVSNLGTSESPVAGMNLMANIKVSTVLKAVEINELFAIRGDTGMLTRVH